ncbi:MAG: hypothetical protein ACAH59_11580, partial [Pseudobdellovibrionaceae bacterium]
GFELRLTGNQDGMIADKCSILLGRPACDPSVMTAPLYNVVINKTGGTTSVENMTFLTNFTAPAANAGAVQALPTSVLTAGRNFIYFKPNPADRKFTGLFKTTHANGIKFNADVRMMDVGAAIAIHEITGNFSAKKLIWNPSGALGLGFSLVSTDAVSEILAENLVMGGDGVTQHMDNLLAGIPTPVVNLYAFDTTAPYARTVLTNSAAITAARLPDLKGRAFYDIVGNFKMSNFKATATADAGANGDQFNALSFSDIWFDNQGQMIWTDDNKNVSLTIDAWGQLQFGDFIIETGSEIFYTQGSFNVRHMTIRDNGGGRVRRIRSISDASVYPGTKFQVGGNYISRGAGLSADICDPATTGGYKVPRSLGYEALIPQPSSGNYAWMCPEGRIGVVMGQNFNTLAPPKSTNIDIDDGMARPLYFEIDRSRRVTILQDSNAGASVEDSFYMIYSVGRLDITGRTLDMRHSPAAPDRRIFFGGLRYSAIAPDDWVTGARVLATGTSGLNIDRVVFFRQALHPATIHGYCDPANQFPVNAASDLFTTLPPTVTYACP